MALPDPNLPRNFIRPLPSRCLLWVAFRFVNWRPGTSYLRYEWHFGCQLLISRWWSRPVTQKVMNQQGLAWRRQAESTRHIAIHIASSSIVRRTKLLSYRWIFAMITYVYYPPSPGAHKKPWSVSLFFIIVSYFTICQRALQAMMWLSLTWILKTRA